MKPSATTMTIRFLGAIAWLVVGYLLLRDFKTWFAMVAIAQSCVLGWHVDEEQKA